MDMKFNELIEARRSVRKYAKAEISKNRPPATWTKTHA